MKTNKFFLKSIALVCISTAIISCGDDDAASLPPIGGYNNSNEIGATDLVAHWPLEGNGIERLSNTAPSNTVGASYEVGAKGQGLKLTNGYLQFPSITNLSSDMNAYTISTWANIKNNQTPESGSVSVFLSLARPGEWEGNLNFYAETGQRPAVELTGAVNDTIVVKAGFRTTASGGQAYENLFRLEPWMIEDNITNPGKHVANPVATGSTWAHYVATWDGATNKFIIYINGVKSSNPAFEVRGDNSSIVFDTPVTPYIGAFGTVATTSDSWNKPMTGNVDEIRVWKKALSSADVNALYQLEKAGR
ncbi:LamG-like jellyroll fold domain-containing protein [Flavobacterium lacus]|uniref:Concanavalin A-like lectin/glucanase superfamily protein n=1 Tax=Flavobacterium lacus TaxID=1353778 RepID=A0A328WRC5_9FLAO|nr:LamG-like jellyroll fold domain-containing protein [Flavobacterium lacus]RAR48882.1 concanavalin A-like lectin/glucanase superfamily protein [Flavobacterium lacus]